MRIRPSIAFARKHFKTTDKIAEVGVFWGVNAVSMYQQLQPNIIYLVDPYLPYAGSSRPTDEAWKRNRVRGTRMVEFLRHEFIYKKSMDALIDVPDGLDLIYIDANHVKEHVIDDITCWWDKVRIGGIFCGHDYDNAKEAPDVKVVVDEMFPTASHEKCDWWIVKETGNELCKAD